MCLKTGSKYNMSENNGKLDKDQVEQINKINSKINFLNIYSKKRNSVSNT